MRLFACLIMALCLLNGCSDSDEAAPQDNVTTEPGTCPEDLAAAEGTPCNSGGQICSNGCGGCSPCWLLECPYGADSVWTAMEAHPPADCQEEPDAGAADSAAVDAAGTGDGPMDTSSTGD